MENERTPLQKVNNALSKVRSDRSISFEEIREGMEAITTPNQELFAQRYRHSDTSSLEALKHPKERCALFLDEYVGYLRRKGHSDPERGAYRILLGMTKHWSDPETKYRGMHWRNALHEFKGEHDLVKEECPF